MKRGEGSGCCRTWLCALEWGHRHNRLLLLLLLDGLLILCVLLVLHVVVAALLQLSTVG